jgi:hypothetical protein
MSTLTQEFTVHKRGNTSDDVVVELQDDAIIIRWREVSSRSEYLAQEINLPREAARDLLIAFQNIYNIVKDDRQ